MRWSQAARQVCHFPDFSAHLLFDRESRDIQADQERLWHVGLWTDRVCKHLRFDPSRRGVSLCHVGSHESAQRTCGVVFSVRVKCEALVDKRRQAIGESIDTSGVGQSVY